MTLRLLFRVAAGPRLGFGHLVRSRSLARAAGAALVASVRGSAATADAARALGFTLVEGPADPAEAADVVVVDDPSADHAGVWVRGARRAGLPVATIHDLGLGYVVSDLGIDGSVEPRHDMHGRFGDLRGPSFAILDPSIALARDVRHAEPATVLVALGGGAYVHAFAAALAQALTLRKPEVRVRAAAGFARRRPPDPLVHGVWVEAPGGLGAELARATVAIAAGGVTMYEACAIGVPMVGVALNAAQEVTVRAMAAHGTALDGGRIDLGQRAIERIADAACRLLDDAGAGDRLAGAGRRLVDGRGAFRVADALRALHVAYHGGIGHAA